MEDSNDSLEINDKIEILSTDDQKIKTVGELLSSDSSRTILKLLFNDHMTANQVAQKTGISLPLVIYHLKKMQEAGIVRVSQTAKNTKSHDMKYYTIDKFAIVILPSELTQKAKSTKSLFSSFNKIYRFAGIGGAAIAAWFTSQFVQHNMYDSGRFVSRSDTTNQMAEKSLQAPQTLQAAPQVTQVFPDPAVQIYISIIITLSVIIIGLIVERIFASRHKKRASRTQQ